jgi:hypothetical protein
VDTERDPKNVAASWRHVLSRSVVNEFIFGTASSRFNFRQPADAAL